MNVTKFEDLKVTTITYLVEFDGEVKKDQLFNLLPITRIEHENKSKRSSKCKLPKCNIPGAILSIKNGSNTRGIVKNEKGGFENGISIDIVTAEKNINAKLAEQSIHMTGVSSEENGLEAATHIINHIKWCQYILDIIQNNMSESIKVMEIVKSLARGPKVEKVLNINAHAGHNYVIMSEVESLNEVALPNALKLMHQMGLTDQRYQYLADYLVKMLVDYNEYGLYVAKLDYIFKQTWVYRGSLEIVEREKLMVNYNYSLGFAVKRSILAELFDDCDGFISHLDPAINVCTRIYLPYQMTDQQLKRYNKKKKKSTKIDNHTKSHVFMIYKSGKVTQSGPGGDIMRDAYYKFMNLIERFYDSIVLEDEEESAVVRTC